MTPRAELTLTEAAVLALLSIEGERSGYDLLKLADRSIGHVWTPAKSQLYATLRRLVGAGLARSRRVRQSSRPDKELYRATRAGEEALQRWLAEPGPEDAFYLKVFVGGLAPVETVLGHVERFREETSARLALYRELETTNTREGHDWYHHLMLRFGIERAETSIRWADGALRELRARAAEPARR